MRVIAFDVNETLLDLRALDGPFREVFGSAGLRGQWFGLMLQLSFVGGLTGDYVDFTTAQYAALGMLAQREGVAVTDDQADALVGGMTTLPPHPDVPDALARVAASPLHVVALTNSPLAVAEAQLANAGVRDHFDTVMSADTVRSLKPTRAPYLSVAQEFTVAPADLRLVAAHSWDVSGALAAGCHAAFVARPGMVMSPLGPQPDIVGADLEAVVDLILTTDV
jgi:2-haloacid dehalogenase